MVEYVKRHIMMLVTVVLFVASCKLMIASRDNRAVAGFGASIIENTVSPAKKVTYEASQSVNFFWKRYLYLLEVEKERDDYLNQIKSLQAQNSRLVEFENENNRLRSLLNFDEENKVRGIPATVIGRNPSNWTRSVTINRGATDGVRQGLPVVDGHAIVGQVIAVSSHASTVLLLTDNTSAIDALVQATRAPGSVEGMLGDTLVMRYVTKDYPLSLGDRVISSGLDRVYPKGKLIGVVVKVGDEKGGMFRSIDIEPSVDFSRLENVLVIESEEREVPQVGKEAPKEK